MKNLNDELRNHLQECKDKLLTKFGHALETAHAIQSIDNFIKASEEKSHLDDAIRIVSAISCGTADLHQIQIDVSNTLSMISDELFDEAQSVITDVQTTPIQLVEIVDENVAEDADTDVNTDAVTTDADTDANTDSVDTDESDAEIAHTEIETIAEETQTVTIKVLAKHPNRQIKKAANIIANLTNTSVDVVTEQLKTLPAEFANIDSNANLDDLKTVVEIEIV